jgi:hypothetical protein
MLTAAIARIKVLFAKNPLAWILAALLIIGMYGRYSLGQNLTKLCDLAQEALEWSPGGETPVASDGSIDVDALIKQIDKERSQLPTEDSLRGEVWRWQDANGKQIEEICAEPAGYGDRDEN